MTAAHESRSLCPPAPDHWPWAPAPMPPEIRALGAEQKRALLAAITPLAAALASTANRMAAAKAIGRAVAEFLPIPIIKDIFKGALDLFEPFVAFGRLISGQKPPCLDPKVPCPSPEHYPDQRTWGRGGESEQDWCCNPSLSGLGVVVFSHAIGLGRPTVRDGFIRVVVPGALGFSGGRFFRTLDQEGRLATKDEVLTANPWFASTGFGGADPLAQLVSGIKVVDLDPSGNQIPPSVKIDPSWVAIVPWDVTADEVAGSMNPGGLPVFTPGNEKGYRLYHYGELQRAVRERRIVARWLKWDMGHRWPGEWEELAAADYANTVGGAGPNFEGRPNSSWTRNFMIVPDGWSITLYPKKNFEGDGLTFGPGAYNVWEDFAAKHDLRDPMFRSARVRGWWTVNDSLQVAALATQQPGWLTADWPRPPSAADAMALVLADPCRLPPPADPAIALPPQPVSVRYAPRPSFWGPGWQQRLAVAQPAGLLRTVGGRPRLEIPAIRELLRQSARYAIAAEQDLNPLIAVLHADYAAGFLYAIQAAFTEGHFRQATGMDFRAVLKQVQQIQDRAHRRLISDCPRLAPQGQLQQLARSAGRRSVY